MAAIPSMKQAIEMGRPKKKMKKPKKARNRNINYDFLRSRVQYLQSNGWDKSKWILFCEEILSFGLVCELYEARQTRSKYITVRLPDDYSRSYKVRFSDHKPIKYRESAGDCDFFVGVTNFKTTTTQQAITETLKFFGINRWDFNHGLNS